MAAELQNVNKLKNNNWNIWKFQIKVILMAKDLHNIVNEERLRPRNTLKQPQRFHEYETGYFSVDINEPTSHEEAMSSNHAAEWQTAMDEELRALDDNDIWKLVDKPEVCDIVNSDNEALVDDNSEEPEEVALIETASELHSIQNVSMQEIFTC
ncbi:hypothetical protein QE152_g28351 [Popillia japonica]|uniref:Retrovirus-related Pol polyprotein from transposon TNT 1-94 n=1 Tax=Popillia japonica TaxID=7064 RepID=A0AAW1JKN6_POPJA